MDLGSRYCRPLRLVWWNCRLPFLSGEDPSITDENRYMPWIPEIKRKRNSVSAIANYMKKFLINAQSTRKFGSITNLSSYLSIFLVHSSSEHTPIFMPKNWIFTDHFIFQFPASGSFVHRNRRNGKSVFLAFSPTRGAHRSTLSISER